MLSYKTLINVLLVVLAVGALFYIMKMKKNRYSNGDTIVESQSVNDVSVGEEEFLPGYDNDTQFERVIPFNSEIESIGCPIDDTDNRLKEYYNKLYGLRDMTDRERAQRALCDFADFRGKTNASSEQFGPDPVDKINALYLSGNGSDARRHQGMTIQEVYDSLTDKNNLVLRHNIRLPDFEHQYCSQSNTV